MSRDRQAKADSTRSPQEVQNWSFDEVFNVLASEGLVYDPGANTLLRQGAFGNVGIVKFDSDDSQPTYIGINPDADALDADTDWTIYNFTYSGENATQIRKKTGSWDGRVALFA